MLRAITVAALLVCGTAAATDGYEYPGTKVELGPATVTLQLNAASIANIDGHEAVWYGVQTADSQQWIQVGLLVDRYRATPCVYLEETFGPDDYTFTCLRSARFGEKITVKYTASTRHGWVAWLNGKAVGGLTLPGPTLKTATAEKYLGGTLSYTIT